MDRKAAGIALFAGTLLISGQGVFAANDNWQVVGTDGREPAVRSTHAGGNEKRKPARPQEKNLTVATAQGNGLSDVAMRFPGKETPSSSLRQERPIDGGTGGAGSGGSWLAMLVAGFGVALVSIIRRMGSIQ